MNSLFVAWRPALPDQTGWRPVGRLEHDGALYRFCYTRGASKPGFSPFTQMNDLNKVYESEALFPVFANRLLSESRPEYEAYLRWSGFEGDKSPDPILILGVTEGIRKTDAVEVFPCPVPDIEGCYTNRFFLHGIRWLPDAVLERVSRLNEGEPLKLMLDLQNKVDPQAVAVRTENEQMQIGYVPRYFAHDVWQLVQQCDVDFIDLHVARVNRDAPMQNRLLCRIRACWPDDFQPCGGEDFTLIPSGVSPHCNR